MKITLSLDDKLVKEVRKIALHRDTTVTGLIRDCLEKLAAENVASEREALERSFRQLQVRVGGQTWRRDDLYNRRQADQ